jgi:hypothetical protein
LAAAEASGLCTWRRAISRRGARARCCRIIELFLEIWTTGISYEDFLHELTSSVVQMGILSPLVNQDIHQLILKGWISFAQGKTHSLDLMRLFFS